MKLFYVDQYGKVQEFNGTEEAKLALANSNNLYFREWDAQEATRGFKTRVNHSLFNHLDYMEKWTLSHAMTPVQVYNLSVASGMCLDSFRRMEKAGLLFDTEEEAKEKSEYIRAYLRGEAEHRASTPKQPQVPQGGQHQPCREERQSQGECSCGRTTSNSECKHHEQDHSSGQGSVKVTVIEMFL